MNIIISMWVDIHKLKQLQDLIKTYDGRFTGPSVGYIKDRLRVTVSFEDPMNYRGFCEDWDRLNTNIVEKTRKKTWLATLKTFWYRLS